MPFIKRSFNPLVILRVLLFISIVILLFINPSPNKYFYSIKKNKNFPVSSKEIKLPPPPLYPVNVTKNLPMDMTAEGVLIKDIPSGVILYTKNEKNRFSPASTTKVMTALVALDKYKLNDILTVNTVMKEGRLMGLIEGETISFESLLYGALVHSGNDAAYTLAENYPGGVNGFVDAMNAKAKELHLDNSHFTNPIGFDHPEHYTTAVDLAKMSEAGLESDIFKKIISTKNITVSDTTFTYFHDLKNVNELLGKIQGVKGIKTGFTENGGEILISEVNKNGKDILIVLLKSRDRFGETEKLINYVFSNFVWITVNELIPAIQD
jgi:D-alanyl-D-alanine carboxypeptidase